MKSETFLCLCKSEFNFLVVNISEFGRFFKMYEKSFVNSFQFHEQINNVGEYTMKFISSTIDKI